jgi:hypothetical protein
MVRPITARRGRSPQNENEVHLPYRDMTGEHERDRDLIANISLHAANGYPTYRVPRQNSYGIMIIHQHSPSFEQPDTEVT